MLAIDADLHITIDGRSAHLTGSGNRLTLSLATAATLRDLLRISLPNLPGGSPSVRDAPAFLAAQGLTVEVRDRKGPLLVVGAEAAGKSLRLPLIGRLRDVELSSRRALLRMAVG